MDPLIAWMDSKNREALLSATDGQVTQALRDLLDVHVQEYPNIDGDRLARAAFVMESANRWHAAKVALGWLAEAPSHARLGAALAVLLVAWNRRPEMPAIDPAEVDDLFSIYAGLSYELISENALIMVLTLLCDPRLPEPVRARVTSVLAEASKRPGRDQVFQDQLDGYLRDWG